MRNRIYVALPCMRSAHTTDIQIVCGIAVLDPQFGDVLTSIQSTCLVQGTGSVEGKGHHDR